IARADVQFASDIAPILQKRCQECHRPGQAAPFPLLTYREAVAHAAQLKDAVTERRMPPWKAAAGFGEVQNEQRLSDAELHALTRWVDDWMQLGDSHRLPPPRKFKSG